jgi:hypothetical protein
VKNREFTYVGKPIPKITTPENKEFVLHFQESMLLSLVKRKLLTKAQMDCVMAELKKQSTGTKK